MRIEEAQAYADDVVGTFMKTDSDWKMGETELFLFWAFQFRYDETPQGMVLTAPPECITKLCDLAPFYREVRPMLRRLISSKLEHGQPLSRVEGETAAAMLMGLMPEGPPAKPGKPRTENFERNVFIVFLAQHLRDQFQLKMTRGHETNAHTSAADVIAQAFEKHRRPDIPLVTFRAVKEVLEDKRLKRYVTALQKRIASRREFQRSYEVANALAARPSAVPDIPW